MKRSEGIGKGSSRCGWVQKRVKGMAILAVSFIMVFMWISKFLAYEITDKLSIGVMLGGAYQYQSFCPEFDEFEKSGGGAIFIRPEISFTPTDRDEVFVKSGFAAAKGLNEKSPFILAPWAADLEDDVKNINGRGRDSLLTAWYKHTFKFSECFALALTGGIIDAAEYLDENAFANDEYTQFMNAAFVKSPIALFPSYDTGAAAELKYHDFSLKGVFMNVGEDDAGNSFNFYGVQLGYKLTTSVGEGNYRLTANFSSKEFMDPAGESKKSLRGLIVSFDQELGEILGAWVRFGVQEDDAAIPYLKLFSGGLNVSGKLWGREKDNIGIGYGYLDGGNMGVDKTEVLEGYVRFVLNEFVAVTMDAQYMKDKYLPYEGTKVDGWIAGLRMTVEF